MEHIITSLAFQVKGYSYMGEYTMFHMQADDGSGIRVMVTIPSGMVITPWPMMNDRFQLITDDWEIVGLRTQNPTPVERSESDAPLIDLFGGTD